MRRLAGERGIFTKSNGEAERMDLVAASLQRRTSAIHQDRALTALFTG